jgi:hypothetical protein
VLRLPGLPEKGDVSDWLAAGGTAEQLRELIAAAEPGGLEAADEREVVILRGGNRSDVLRQIEAVLRDPAKVRPGWIFARGKTNAALLLTVDAAKLRAGGVEITLPPRTAYLAAAKPEQMCGLLDELFQLRRSKRGRNGEEHEIPCDCPIDLGRYVLVNAQLLPLLSISRTPVLRMNGSVLEKPGYDRATGIYYAPEIEFPAVPERPTRDDARRGYERLCRPFRGFPFATEADKAAVVGEVLTLLTRHLVPRAPAFLHNATEAGSGKTKLFDTVAIIALGSNPALLNADILDDETELRKVLTTLTLSAAPLAVFDNVKRGGEIGSPGLANFLTATIYSDRLLCVNETVEATICTTVGLTGNGCEVVGDNTRRVVRVDLDAGMERPELRAFAFDCEVEARAERGELVAAALTMLRAHALEGRPQVPGRSVLGSFEDWDRLVSGALVFAGAPDPLVLLDKTRTADPERNRLGEVLRVLKALGGEQSAMKAGEIIWAAQEALRRRTGDEKAEAQEWVDTLGRFGKDGVPNARSLGRYLTMNAGRVFDGMRLQAVFDAHTKSNSFKVRIDHPKPETRGNAEFQPVATEPQPADPNTGFAGFAGFAGFFPSPFLRDAEGRDSHNAHHVCKQVILLCHMTGQDVDLPRFSRSIR